MKTVKVNVEHAGVSVWSFVTFDLVHPAKVHFSLVS